MNKYVKSTTLTVILGIAVLVIAIGYVLWSNGHSVQSNTSNNSGALHIVAAENFWGSLVSELGGTRVSVTSIVSDPNADPHEYESNSTDARKIATADYVVLNGAGYDSWANKLVDASPNQNRKVRNIANLVGKKEGDNPHLWYNPAYVNQAVVQMDKDLISLDPSGKQYYVQRLQYVQSAVKQYQDRISLIKQKFGGTKVAATEDIFAYLAASAGLNLISPPAFTEAVAEGNDPPAESIVQFQQQLESGQVKVLVYNEQTVTPLTNSMKALAATKKIPIVGITETIQPPNLTFQAWMNAQLINLNNALNSSIPGR